MSIKGLYNKVGNARVFKAAVTLLGMYEGYNIYIYLSLYIYTYISIYTYILICIYILYVL
jgi:hypothetical protein